MRARRNVHRRDSTCGVRLPTFVVNLAFPVQVAVACSRLISTPHESNVTVWDWSCSKARLRTLVLIDGQYAWMGSTLSVSNACR